MEGEDYHESWAGAGHQTGNGDMMDDGTFTINPTFSDRRWARFQGSYFSPAPKSGGRG